MRLRLHYRIVIPFGIVSLLAISAAAVVAVSEISRALEARVRAQMLSMSAVVSRSDFALNPSILRTIKEITGADVVTYTTQGTILASTVNEGRADIVSAVTAPDVTQRALSAAEDAPVVEHMMCGAPCDVAYRRVVARPDTVVALIAETSALSAATRAVARTILLVAALSLTAMLLVSQVVARRFTAPIEQLVAVTRDVSPEGSRRRAPASLTGDDEIGRLARSFNEMLDRLERSRDALVRSEKLALTGLLAARIAHDIRNPLSSIKMQTQLLQAHVRGDEHGQAIVAAVLHDVSQVESVIRDLLELARPGELKLRSTPLNDVVRDVLRYLGAQLAHRKIAVETSLAEPLPAIPLDVDRFKQALVNVIVNAADAMPNGGRLSVMTRTAEHGSRIVLDVYDDGIGVDPAILGRVFDPFVSTKRDGVGLGLVNTKAVVESHGGRIELAPNSPRGTHASISFTVAVDVPLSDAPRTLEDLHG